MYVNVMETRVQKEVRDLSRVLAHVLTDCLRGGIPSRLLAATIVPAATRRLRCVWTKKGSLRGDSILTKSLSAIPARDQLRGRPRA